MITKATSPGYLYAVTTDSTCLITDVDTRYNLCKAVVNKQGMFVAIGGSVECSDDNVLLTQASTTSGGTRFEVVTTRPEVGETGVIYLVPASNSTTENLYEEWVWVDDKWEQIGSAGLNLSNYAQLTTANTFSAANTFNGNLIKKTSTTALADNSVLNRSEMDNRYGKLSGGNSWQGEQVINGVLLSNKLRTSGMIALEGSEGQVGLSAMKAITIGSDLAVSRDAEIYGKLKVYGDAGICIHSASGVLELNQLNSWKDINGQKNSCIQVLASLHLNNHKLEGVHTGYMEYLYVDEVHSTSSQIVVARSIHMGDNNITHVDRFAARSMYISEGASVMGTLVASNINTANGSLTINTPYGHTKFVHGVNMQSGVSIVGTLGVVGQLTAGSEEDTIDVQANLHMTGNNIVAVSSISSNEVIAKRELCAVDLSSTFGAPDKYGIRITNTSCQLFGTDFVFGDAWTYAQDYAAAYGNTITYPLTAPTSLELIKVMKPGVSIATEDQGYLSFDYAKQVYIRTFPSDGGQALFEFQGGHWTDDNHNNVKLGAVDIRKASAETLHPTSLLNMTEGDARWGSGGSDYIKVATDIQNASGANIKDGYYRGTGVGIGAQVDLTDSDIVAIGARIDAQSQGYPYKITMLGYQLAAAGPTASRMIALGGYAKTTGYMHVYNGAISIGYSDHYDSAKEGSVVIGNNAQARSSFGTAIGADAIASGVHSLSLGLTSYANGTYGIALGGQACASGTRAIAIGGQTKAYGNAALCIGNESRIGADGAPADGSTALGPVANCASTQAVAVGGWSTIGTSANGATALGYTARVYKNSSNGIAIGCNAAVGDKSIAIGANAEAIHGSIVIGANGKAIFPGILISNIGNDVNSSNSLGSGGTTDTGICLSAAAIDWPANSIIFELSSNYTRSTDEAVIFRSIDDKYEADTYGHCSREAFASILNNARLGNYPAQPFVEVTPLHIDKLYSLQPNTVYHVQINPTIEPEPLDLSRLAFDLSVTGIPTAELHIVTNDNRNISNIIWPSNMLWPDEADQTVAPAIETPTDKIRCYVFTVRRQIIYGTEYLIGALAYKMDV